MAEEMGDPIQGKTKVYFDIESKHNLQPLIPERKSYNRNFALTFGHSGV